MAVRGRGRGAGDADGGGPAAGVRRLLRAAAGDDGARCRDRAGAPGDPGAAQPAARCRRGPGAGSPRRDRVLEVEANIDDMSPQRFELLIERALAAGALDVAILPATMKKNRPGWVLRLLCPEERLEIVSSAVFSVSTAIGLRFHACDRMKLDRAARMPRRVTGASG